MKIFCIAVGPGSTTLAAKENTIGLIWQKRFTIMRHRNQHPGGLFQIMGYHWENLGYKSVKDFVRLMHKSEGEHIKAFGRFILSNNLTKYLKNKNWAGFARRYNGPGYKTNKYDEKLARAYNKYK